MTKPILVTGGCGFVGRHLTERLLDAGHDVHIVDNGQSGLEPERWLGDEYAKTDSEEFTVFDGTGRLTFFANDVREFVRERSAATYSDVFHLAAVIGGRSSIDHEPLRVASDLAIDARFFNWVVQDPPNQVLYASSSAAYPVRLQTGDPEIKLQEDHISFDDTIGVPDMTYGWSKLTGEYLAQYAASQHDLSVSVVRPFSGYGGDQSFDYPLPSIARRALRREDPLTVWGTGEQIRDFIHIDDCIEAMLRAIDTIDDGSAVNLGTGVPTNFKTVASRFAELADYDPKIKSLPDKPEGPKYRCADTTRMRDTLDWEPSISVEEGFERVFDKVKARTTDERQ